MKKLICLILAWMLSLSLCACDAAEEILEMGKTLNTKTYTVDNLSIDLTREFLRMDMLAQDFDFAVSDGDITVFGESVDYAEYELFGISAWDYAAAFRESMTDKSVTEVTDLEGIPTLQYTATDDDGEQLTYVVAVYEASDRFWILQFCFETDDYDELYPLVKQYALSVKCN